MNSVYRFSPIKHGFELGCLNFSTNSMIFIIMSQWGLSYSIIYESENWLLHFMTSSESDEKSWRSSLKCDWLKCEILMTSRNGLKTQFSSKYENWVCEILLAAQQLVGRRHFRSWRELCSVCDVTREERREMTSWCVWLHFDISDVTYRTVVMWIRQSNLMNMYDKTWQQHENWWRHTYLNCRVKTMTFCPKQWFIIVFMNNKGLGYSVKPNYIILKQYLSEQFDVI